MCVHKHGTVYILDKHYVMQHNLTISCPHTRSFSMHLVFVGRVSTLCLLAIYTPYLISPTRTRYDESYFGYDRDVMVKASHTIVGPQSLHVMLLLYLLLVLV